MALATRGMDPSVSPGLSCSSNWTTPVFVSFAGLTGKSFTDFLEGVRKK